MISKEELELDLSRKSPEWWANAKRLVGKENYYFDRACHFGLVTVDRDPGTTPMFMACRNPKGCSGVMNSMGYPDPASKPAWLGEATHEWYRPNEIDEEAEDDPEADHLMNGGLLIRKIEVVSDR